MNTKTVEIRLWAQERIIKRRDVVIQVPEDATVEEIEEMTGEWLDNVLRSIGAASSWVEDECDGLEVSETVDVEGEADSDSPVGLRFVRNDAGHLVLDQLIRERLRRERHGTDRQQCDDDWREFGF